MSRARARAVSAFSFAILIAFAPPVAAAMAAAGAERSEDFCCCREKGMAIPDGEVCPMCDHQAGAGKPAFRTCAPSGPAATIIGFNVGRLVPTTEIVSSCATEIVPPSTAASTASFARIPPVPPPRFIR